MKWFPALLACIMLGTGTTPASDSSASASMLARPYAQFGFDVLRELRSERPGENVFISPTSIAVALAMTSNGASGTTRDAILRTLHADTQSLEAFNAANRALAAEIAATRSVQLSMANALWVQQGFPLKPAFTQTLQSAYSAQAANLDFRSPAAIQAVNGWVAKHTNDRIAKILDEIDPSTVAILANAIAFKGKWTLQFDPKETQPRDFTTGTGAVHQLPMMKHSAEYAYANGNGLEAIRLPYADRTFAMYVVLPQDPAGMQSFLRQLTPDSFAALNSSLQERRGTIELPRFTISFNATLNAILKKLGMGIAFSGGADFSGISDQSRLEISEVRHASFLKVDEEGTEAAAATITGIRPAMARFEPPPFHMIVDRPFFVAIRDERDGQLLFTGTIFDPAS